MDSLQRMVDTQARLISKLNDDIRDLQKTNRTLQDRLAARDQNADYYKLIVESVKNDPAAQAAWIEFITYLKMTDLNVAGLTK